MTPDGLRGARAGDLPLIARNDHTGTVLANTVEVAATHAARRRGLMGRASLPAGHALWIVPSRGVHTCGMRFAIDVVALDRRGVVVDVVTDLRPWRIRLPRPGTLGVLELPAGTVRATRTGLGQRITFEASAEDARGRAS